MTLNDQWQTKAPPKEIWSYVQRHEGEKGNDFLVRIGATTKNTTDYFGDLIYTLNDLQFSYDGSRDEVIYWKVCYTNKTRRPSDSTIIPPMNYLLISNLKNVDTLNPNELQHWLQTNL